MHADGVYVFGLEEQTMAPMMPRNHVLWPVTGGIPHFPTARKIDDVCQTGSCYDIRKDNLLKGDQRVVRTAELTLSTNIQII